MLHRLVRDVISVRTVLVILIALAASILIPARSATGQDNLIYTSCFQGETGHRYFCNLNPVDATISGILTDPYSEYISVSRDGDHVAFVVGSSVYISSIDGSGASVVGTLPEGFFLLHPIALNKDASKIAFKGQGQVNLVVMDVATGSVTSMTVENISSGGFLEWSPSGEKLIYGRSISNAVFMRNADGSGDEVQITTPGENEQDSAADWSLDGEMIVVFRYNAIDEKSYVVQVDVATGANTVVNTTAYVDQWLQSIEVSPDGQRIAFRYNTLPMETNVSAMSINGGPLTTFYSHINPVGVPTSPVVFDMYEWTGVPQELIVNKTGDEADMAIDGICDTDAGTAGRQCTLRAAIQEGNSIGGAYNISFDLPSSQSLITIGSKLPDLDGSPKIVAEDNPSGAKSIRIHGNGLAADGLVFVGKNATLEGVAMTGFKGAAVVFKGEGGHSIESSFIGTNEAGSMAIANGAGVLLLSANNTVESNLISGNDGSTIGGSVIDAWKGSGIVVSSSAATGAQIIGNTIGLNLAGSDSLANSVGVYISEASGAIIGGEDAEDRNIISGNTKDGVRLFGEGSTGITMQGNIIGLNKDGTSALGNRARGVNIFNASTSVIGGETSELRNIISGNGGGGVVIVGTKSTGVKVQGNYIGVSLDGSKALANGADADSPTQNGIFIQYATNVQIGGSTETPGSAPGNVVSGNRGSGISAFGENASGEKGPVTNLSILGNIIGLNASGADSLINGVEGSVAISISGNVPGAQIGQTGGSNLIAVNKAIGIRLGQLSETVGAPDGSIVSANKIGVNRAGTALIGSISTGIYVASVNRTLEGGVSAVTIGGPQKTDGNLIATGNESAYGVLVEGNRSGGATISSNTVGLLSNGDLSSSERSAFGIALFMSDDSELNANVVGGCFYGIFLAASTTRITKNYLGVDPSGELARPNQWGIFIVGNLNFGGTFQTTGVNNTIGGSTKDDGNLISANIRAGVALVNSVEVFSGQGESRPGAPDNNLISNNRIGSDISGTKKLGNGRSLDLPTNFGGVAVLDGSENRIVANTLVNNGSGININPDQLRLGNPRATFIAANSIGLVPETGAIMPSQTEGIYISSSDFNTIASEEIDGVDRGNVIVGSEGDAGVSIYFREGMGAQNKISQVSFRDNKGPSILIFDGEGVPTPPGIIRAVLSPDGVLVKARVNGDGPLEFYISDSCPNGNAQGSYFATVPDLVPNVHDILLTASTLPGGISGVEGMFIGITASDPEPLQTTGPFSNCVRIATEEASEVVTIAEGQTGEVLSGGNGLQVNITSNQAAQKGGLRSQDMTSSGSGDLFSTRFDFVGPSISEFDNGAMAPDGSIVTPDVTASLRYWTLSADSLAGLTYDACLDVTGIDSLNNPGQALVLHRIDGTQAWTSYDSSLEDDESNLCASGFTELGDLAIGTVESVNPVPVEEDETPTEFDITAAYPNPFSSRVNIDIDNDRGRHFKVVVVDLLGRTIQTMLDGRLEAGRRTLAFNADSLPNGHYLIQISSEDGGINEVRKVVLVR